MIECLPIVVETELYFSASHCVTFIYHIASNVVDPMLCSVGYQPNYGTVSGIFYKEKFIKSKPIEIS